MTAKAINRRAKNIQTPEQAREFAADWQRWQSERAMSWMQATEWMCLFEELGERFGLTEEFRENGIV